MIPAGGEGVSDRPVLCGRRLGRNAAQLKNLMRKGALARIYMHLLSLQNFARLLERKAARS